tara:strand:- start:833 stop:1441 length:609 start_codon:yes stop_codon:yes gene_type:complete
VIEVLYKKKIPFLLIFNVFIFSNSFDEKDYFLKNFIPYQESKISIGINTNYNSLNENQSINHSLFLNNWFTDNLYLSGLISTIKNSNDIQLRYNMSIGYSYNSSNSILKSVVPILGYNRIRFKNNNEDNTNISFDLLFSIQLDKYWVSLSFGIIDDIENSKNLSLKLLKSISNSFIFALGAKYSVNKNNNITTPYILLGYKI